MLSLQQNYKYCGFDRKTFIKTKKGNKLISDVTTNDFVLSLNRLDNKLYWKKVLFSDKICRSRLFRIVLNDESIMKLTYQQKLYTIRNGFVVASDIVLNDSVVYINKENELTLTKIKYSVSSIHDDVYNLIVNECNNFFANGILAEDYSIMKGRINYEEVY